jgi:hypothetical protein
MVEGDMGLAEPLRHRSQDLRNAHLGLVSQYRSD